MSNFKSGSGDLDFGGSDTDDDPDETVDGSTPNDPSNTSTDETESATAATASTPTERAEPNGATRETDEQDPTREPADTGSNPSPNRDQYPYFVRRNNVGDERDTRLEIHVRDGVAEQEAAFRNDVAAALETNEIAKTDAREFALLLAFEHPERVAELMEEEGFGALD
ncbi:acyl-CoA dehydrogenase [Salinadaptatus halalkaliphilus]|uniref:Acyl-CoA dehydrogenase n=1 Tax=Salinadaptatus halalkaliphilus TaxID=2419781 RepID=A0A4V3VL28_9EURY|nr:acyl-CoA dehydrogenase [Salinadaptatus halalkaliphilus]THE64007.1 acyl-CoA dehydrogenase [Salinadaptatus halalkaliphilus]